MIEEAGTDKRVHALASRSTFKIGSYLGVPVVLGHGQLYGTLCVLDPDPHRFAPQDLDLLLILGAWIQLYLK